jgi:hypothetical protein
MRTFPVPSSITFAGLKSRCTTPRSCAACNFQRAILRESSDAAKQRRQIFAVDVFHRQEGLAVHFVDVVDPADVGVRHHTGHADLGVELGQARGVGIDVGGQELERNRLSEFQIVGAIHLAHPAASQPADDAIASAKQRAGLEPAVIDRP